MFNLNSNPLEALVDRLNLNVFLPSARLTLRFGAVLLTPSLMFSVAVLQGGSVAVNTGVRGHMDAVLVVTMRDFVESMVRVPSQSR